MTISLVQQTTAASSAPGLALNATLGATPIVGHTMVIVYSSDSTIDTPAGWTKAAGIIDFSDLGCFTRSVQSGDSATEGVTWATGSVNSGTEIWLAEFAGMGSLAGAAIVDQFATNAAGPTSVTSVGTGTTATTLNPNDLIIVAAGYDNVNATFLTSSWTNGFADAGNIQSTNGSPNTSLYVGSQVVSSTGAYTSTATVSTNVAHLIGFIVAFSPSGAVAPPVRVVSQAVQRSASW